jgi:hypothetical protein
MRGPYNILYDRAFFPHAYEYEMRQLNDNNLSNFIMSGFMDGLTAQRNSLMDTRYPSSSEFGTNSYHNSNQSTIHYSRDNEDEDYDEEEDEEDYEDDLVEFELIDDHDGDSSSDTAQMREQDEFNENEENGGYSDADGGANGEYSDEVMTFDIRVPLTMEDVDPKLHALVERMSMAGAGAAVDFETFPLPIRDVTRSLELRDPTAVRLGYSDWVFDLGDAVDFVDGGRGGGRGRGGGSSSHSGQSQGWNTSYSSRPSSGSPDDPEGRRGGGQGGAGVGGGGGSKIHHRDHHVPPFVPIEKGGEDPPKKK